MASFRRAPFPVLIGLSVSAAAVYLSLRQIDFPALGAALRSADYRYLLPALAAQASCFFLKGNAWRYLLRPAKKNISPLATTSVLIVGLMVNNLLPAKMGELARAYLMGERERLPKSLCLSTVLVEHLLDILVLLGFLLVLLPLVALPPWLKTGGLVIGFGALAFIAALFLLVRREEKFLFWILRAAGLLSAKAREKAEILAGNVLRGLRAVAGRYLLYAFFFLAGMWSMVSFTAYLIMGAFGLALPVQAAVMVTVFTAFGKIIPSSPGAIGTYHYLVILVLGPFGVGKETALAYALVLHAVSFLMEILLGAALLLAGRLSLARIAREAREAG